jgi:hypothetical protein
MRTFRIALLSHLLVVVTVAGLASPVWASERFRTLWQGRWVDYVEVGEFAVTDGDIIIGAKDAVREWRLAVERGQQQMAAARESGKALTIDSAGRLWQRAASGVVEVPYTIEAGNSATINAAVAEVNRVLSGVLQWVPHTGQSDYVAFSTTAVNSGACSSFVGRVGGRQQISGDPECGVSTFIHEMGHAMGLWHIQQDASAGAFVDLRLDRMDPARRSNNEPIFSTRTMGGYDYGSIMHYSRTSFPASGDRVTLETKPAGIDVGGTGTYSPADIDGLLRLYGAAPQRTTVTTNPPGLRLVVDGVTVTTPVVLDWPVGTVHRVWATDEVQSSAGFRFAFGRWSHDGGATPSRQLTWQVSAGDGSLGSPRGAPSATVLTANFVRLIEVTPTAGVQAGGTSAVVPRSAPWPGTTSLYPQFSSFDLSAAPATGFQHYFTWGGAFASAGGAGLLPRVSLLLTGSLSQQTIGALFHSGSSIAVNATGDGIIDGVNVRITPPGGTVGTSVAPRLARTTPGTWKFEMTSPQLIGSSIRHVLDGYDGFDNATTGEVDMPATGTRSVTIRAHRELAPYRQAIPSCGGSVTLSNSAAWLRFGAPLTAAAATTGTAIFTGWSGSISGTAPVVATTVGAAVPEFVATFNTVNEPLRLLDVSPAILGDDSTPVTLQLRGTGFTPDSMVVVAGIAYRPSYVDRQTLRVTVNRNEVGTLGQQTIYVLNALSQICFVGSNSLALEILPSGTRVAVTLTEYYNASLDYYFLTGRSGDKAVLDALPEWARTGSEIRLYAAPNTKTAPLERHFFARVARGGSRGSHFFTASVAEQPLLTGLNPGNLQLDARPFLEGIEGYAVPADSSGACPATTQPVYRAFKGAPRYSDDGNHRFSTSLSQHQDMVTRLGWTDEGVVFCAL